MTVNITVAPSGVVIGGPPGLVSEPGTGYLDGDTVTFADPLWGTNHHHVQDFPAARCLRRAVLYPVLPPPAPRKHRRGHVSSAEIGNRLPHP